MRLEHPMLVLGEVEGECVERVGGPEPYEARCPRVEVGLELVSVVAAKSAVDAIGGDDEVSVGKAQCFEIRDVAQLGAESELDTQFGCTCLENVEKLLTSDAAEAVAARGDSPAVDKNVDIVPMREVVGDRAECGLVGSSKIL